MKRTGAASVAVLVQSGMHSQGSVSDIIDGSSGEPNAKWWIRAAGPGKTTTDRAMGIEPVTWGSSSEEDVKFVRRTTVQGTDDRCPPLNQGKTGWSDTSATNSISVMVETVAKVETFLGSGQWVDYDSNTSNIPQAAIDSAMSSKPEIHSVAISVTAFISEAGVVTYSDWTYPAGGDSTHNETDEVYSIDPDTAEIRDKTSLTISGSMLDTNTGHDEISVVAAFERTKTPHNPNQC